MWPPTEFVDETCCYTTLAFELDRGGMRRPSTPKGSSKTSCLHLDLLPNRNFVVLCEFTL